MIERSFVHVASPSGSGKTTFIERLLEANVAYAIWVRGVFDGALPRSSPGRTLVSSPKDSAELRRYRDSGVPNAVLYRFAEPGTDAFFISDFMMDYSTAVFIEGDCPAWHPYLPVFIAPVLPPGTPLLRRVCTEHKVDPRESMLVWSD